MDETSKSMISVIEQYIKTLKNNNIQSGVISSAYNCITLIEERGAKIGWEQFSNLLVQDPLSTSIIQDNKYDVIPVHCSKRVLLLDVLTQQPSLKALVFVKTRISAMETVEFLRENNLNACLMLGHDSMSIPEQSRVIDDFKSIYNVMVATSVAEEGLDIPSCNLVVRMDGIDNALQLIQSRGRARSKESRFICIMYNHEQNLNTCESHENNMFKAIDVLIENERHNPNLYRRDTRAIEDTISISHIIYTVWNSCVIANPSTTVLHRGSCSNVLSSNVKYLFDASVEYKIYKRGDDHQPEYLGSVEIPLKGCSQADKLVICADSWCLNTKDAKIAAAQKALIELNRRELIILQNDPQEANEKKNTKDLIKIDGNNFDHIIHEQNAVNVLNVCQSIDPTYHFTEVQKRIQCECLLFDKSIAVTSDHHIDQRSAKRQAAIKMLMAIIDLNGFIKV
ncbi:hypothetical protein AKO1_015735, partial [Acrasis kona]